MRVEQKISMATKEGLGNTDRTEILFAYITNLSELQNKKPRNFEQEGILAQRFNLDMEGLMKGNVNTHYFIENVWADTQRTLSDIISVVKDENSKTHKTIFIRSRSVILTGNEGYFGFVRGDKAETKGTREKVSGLAEDKWYLHFGNIGEGQRQFFFPVSTINKVKISSVLRTEGFEAFCKK